MNQFSDTALWLWNEFAVWAVDTCNKLQLQWSSLSPERQTAVAFTALCLFFFGLIMSYRSAWQRAQAVLDNVPTASVFNNEYVFSADEFVKDMIARQNVFSCDMWDKLTAQQDSTNNTLREVVEQLSATQQVTHTETMAAMSRLVECIENVLEEPEEVT